MGQSSGWLISRNSITPFCAATAASECVHTFMPSVAGVAQAGKGFGAFSTCTRHMRQLAAMVSLRCQQKCGTYRSSLCAASMTVLPLRSEEHTSELQSPGDL